MDLLKKICNLKGSVVFPPYRWTDGVKVFYVSRNIQRGWEGYKGVMNTTYYVGHIETGHHVICSMPEETENHFAFPNFTIPVLGGLPQDFDFLAFPKNKFQCL